MTKELLTVEFRYRDKPKSDYESSHQTKIITIGVYDRLEEAINEGNKALTVLSKSFQVRADDKFSLRALFGRPQRLVTNTCYPTNGIEYFAKITQLKFDDLGEVIKGVFAASERYKVYKTEMQ